LPDALAATRWDEEYRQGRYLAEPPLPFVDTILAVLRCRGLTQARGLYVGCGNGRNFVPLADAGLALEGLDVSGEALRQLAARCPASAGRLVHGDLRDLQPGTPFGYIVAIQVFQHGTAADALAYFERAQALLAPGGLLFVRVNSASTQVFHRHEIVETGAEGGFTVRYLEGPKRGLAVHFYSRSELDAVTREAFQDVLPPREDVIRRAPPGRGFWAQWEAVYRTRR
jgi:SAM-dependent methyltransferase